MKNRISKETLELAKEVGIDIKVQCNLSILRGLIEEDYKMYCSVMPYKDHASDINDPVLFKPYIFGRNTRGAYSTYEEAMDAALYQALEKILFLARAKQGI